MFKAVMFLTLLAAVPASETYTLPSYNFDNGAGASSSSTYRLNSSVGSSGGTLSSATYTLPAGIRASTTVRTPAAPTFTNPDSSYNRLSLTLVVAGFPSDVKYAIAISDDNFVSTKYVQTDQTIGTGFSVSNYRTYASWGGASGFFVQGLANGTTYKVKVAALQGNATGSAFGPTATAATVTPSVTFGLQTSLTSTPPFISTFTSLTPGSVVTANATVTALVTTNAQQGMLQLNDQNAGLTSPSKSTTISSSTADLTAALTGYGAQVTATSQSAGGPMNSVSPFNGTSNNVGGLTAVKQSIASFASPVTSGSVTFALLAKASNITPAAVDYADTLTITLGLVF